MEKGCASNRIAGLGIYLLTYLCLQISYWIRHEFPERTKHQSLDVNPYRVKVENMLSILEPLRPVYSSE
jgi:hypothetical protein